MKVEYPLHAFSHGTSSTFMSINYDHVKYLLKHIFIRNYKIKSVGKKNVTILPLVFFFSFGYNQTQPTKYNILKKVVSSLF